MKIIFGDGCDGDVFDSLFGALIGYVIRVNDTDMMLAATQSWDHSVGLAGREWDGDKLKSSGKSVFVEWDDITEVEIY